MSLQLPNPVPAASAAGPGFPVYNPSNPQSMGNQETAAPANPLGDYHKVAAEEPGNERELLFTIGGKPLYAPRDEDIDPSLGFKMIRDIRKFGPMIASANMMGELLGDEALDLLADAPKMTKEEWDVIMEVLTDKVFSKFQGMPGAGGKG